MCWECWRWVGMYSMAPVVVRLCCVWWIWSPSMSARLLWPELAFMQEWKPSRHVITGPGKCHPLPEKNQLSMQLEWMAHESNLTKVAGKALDAWWDASSGNGGCNLVIVLGRDQASIQECGVTHLCCVCFCKWAAGPCWVQPSGLTREEAMESKWQLSSGQETNRWVTASSKPSHATRHRKTVVCWKPLNPLRKYLEWREAPKGLCP